MKNKSKIISLVLFCIYAVLTLTAVFFHEPWQDELHAWVMARELNVFQIFYWMRYDGHFAIWHLILMPFAAGGLPLAALSLIGWSLCTIGTGLLFFRTRLPLWVRSLVLFSCPLFYYFPVVCRAYCLIPLTLYFLIALYPVRLRKPFRYAFSILLLLYIHSYLAGMAGMLGLFFLIDLVRHYRNLQGDRFWKKVLPPPALMLLGALCAFLMVFPAVGESSVVPKTFHDFFDQSLSAGLARTLNSWPSVYFTNSLAFLIGRTTVTVLFWLATLAGLFSLFKRSVGIGMIWLGGTVWMLLMSALVYPMLMHRAYLPFLFLFFCLSLPPAKKIRREPPRWLQPLSCAAVALLASMTFPDSLAMFANEINHPFSNQGQMAMFIEQNIPKDAKIVTFPSDLISSTLTAFLPDHQLYDCETNQRYRVYRKKGRVPSVLNDAVLHYYSDKNKPFYLMLNTAMIDFYGLSGEKPARGLKYFRVEPLYRTNPPAFFPAREDYGIFKVTPLE